MRRSIQLTEQKLRIENKRKIQKKKQENRRKKERKNPNKHFLDDEKYLAKRTETSNRK